MVVCEFLLFALQLNAFMEHSSVDKIALRLNRVIMIGCENISTPQKHYFCTSGSSSRRGIFYRLCLSFLNRGEMGRSLVTTGRMTTSQ